MKAPAGAEGSCKGRRQKAEGGSQGAPAGPWLFLRGMSMDDHQGGRGPEVRGGR